MVKKYINFLQFVLIFVFLSFAPDNIYAQCAGEDAVPFSVCNVSDSSSRTIDLFSKLTGSPLTGGVWTDNNGTGGLNATTGVLNVQQIRRSGTFTYTYTVEGIGLCPDNSSVVTVTVGGYAGVPSNAVVCSSIESYNLFQAFNGLFLGPQSNGKWHNDTTDRDLETSIINVTNLKGDYTFTYTMPAIGGCPAVSATTVISVYRAPQSGTPLGLLLCATDGLSDHTNVDLHEYLIDEDPGGIWTDLDGTGELNYAGDHFIDVQRIYNRYGVGTYTFSYFVPSTENPICTNAESTVRVIIENRLDFTGSIFTVNSDICETEILTATYTGVIDAQSLSIPDGAYNILYRISGPNGNNAIAQSNFVNGVVTFPIESKYFQQVGNYTVTITDMLLQSSSRACRNIVNLSDILSVYPIPDLIGSKIETVTACQNTSALVTITEATRVANGTYDILYNISGVNNITSQTATVTFVDGTATFTLPAILNSQSGNSTITITNIKHVSTSCTNTANIRGNIIVNPLPNATTLRIQVPDVCFGSAATASVSGLGTLTDVTLSYVFSDGNISTSETVVLTPVNGNASFVIPANLIVNSGATTITVTNLKNNTTTCSSDVSGLFASFLVNPIPIAPTVADQSFCKSAGVTISSLQPNGAQYKWYNSSTLTTPLASNYLLKDEIYYVTETISGCTSPSAMVTVTLNDIPAPELNTDGQNFCGLDAPTIAQLSNNTNIPSSVVWYDAKTNGNLLAPITPLVDKKKYYGFDVLSPENCLSYDSLEVTVSLTDCDVVPPDFFIPDGFSPNGDGVNDIFVIPNIDFLFPDYTIEIFNRYGNGMYRGGKDKPGWDGINYETSGISHGIAPNGVYFYIIHFNKDNKPPKQGRLYLNR